ncbi:MAG: DCC1-like thiol-disulfide oxidoreductase family protein [Polyangiaceae bacterium]
MSGAVLLYDGECGFCARGVQFVLRHDTALRSLCFAPLSGALAQRVREQHPELAGVDSMVWYEVDERSGASRVRVRSEAALAIGEYLGGGFLVLARLGSVVPRALRDAVYRAVAARRGALSAEACVVPLPSERARFLA